MASSTGAHANGSSHTHGVVLIYRFSLDAPPDVLPETLAPRAFGPYGLVLALHAHRGGRHRSWSPGRLVGAEHVLAWRLAVEGNGWRTFRTVASPAAWRRLWTPGPSFHFRCDPGRLALSVTRADSPELDLTARYDGTTPPSVLGHPRRVEAELLEAPGAAELVRGSLALEPLRLEKVSCPWLEEGGRAVPDSVYRLVDRRAVGSTAGRELLRDARTAPILPTPS